MKKSTSITSQFDRNAQAVLHEGDALKLLASIPDNFFQLIVTSPPYNLGKSYEKRTDVSKYLLWQEDVISECVRTLKPNGSICWQVGNYIAYDLFVKHLAFYVKDQIDVGVEILPMKSLQSQMSSGPGYYEGELYNVIRNGRGVPSVPLVIIGIAP